MSTASKKIPLAQAEQIANDLVTALLAQCERIEVAGSIRRKKPIVGDIEIVAVPKIVTCSVDLMGELVLHRPLNKSLEDMMDRGVLKHSKGFRGNIWKYSQFSISAHACNLDLFLATPNNFGLIFMLRTGPAEFSKRLVTPRLRGGLLPSFLRVSEGWIVNGKRSIPTLEEADVWRILDLAPIAPEDRV